LLALRLAISTTRLDAGILGIAALVCLFYNRLGDASGRWYIHPARLDAEAQSKPGNE
jgi:hypothetical protein